MIGQKVGNYAVVKLLGQGGMGQVFEAVHEQLRRRAAIKVLRPEYSRNKEVVARFFNEALAVNVIQHPSIVSVFESGCLPDGSAYIVMEFLDGVNLQSLVESRGALAEAEALLLARQAASALAAAHAKEIVHRDLKAENVMLVNDPEVPGGKRVKILDFGLAKIAAKHAGAHAIVTKDGTQMGTPAYMAPEQWMSATMADAKTDAYALGVLLYLMLTGQFPFDGDNINQLMTQHMYEAPASLRKLAPTLSHQTVDLVDALLAKTQKARPTMAEASARIEKLLPSLAQKPIANTAPPVSAANNRIESAATQLAGEGQLNPRAEGGPPPVSNDSVTQIAPQKQGGQFPGSNDSVTQIAPQKPGDMAWTRIQVEPNDATKLVPTVKHTPKTPLPASRSSVVRFAVLGAFVLLGLALVALLIR